MEDLSHSLGSATAGRRRYAQGGDRPPGSQPGGMSKSKFRSFPQNAEIIPKRRARLQARRGEKAVETVLLFCLASIHFSFTIGELQLYRW